jgi:hypothetical protein
MLHCGSGAAVGSAAIPRDSASLLSVSTPPSTVERRSSGWHRRTGMLDTIMLAAGVAFFALAIAYVAACDKM